MPIKDCKIKKTVLIKNKDLVNLYGCTIDDYSKVGPFVEIQKNVTIGKKCKISSHSFICEGVKISNYCFIGHNVAFTNDKYPRATNKDLSLKNNKDYKMLNIFLEKNVSIGSGSVILGGVRIGENSIIGAGSVVTRNVKKNSIYFGNPAKFIRKI